MAGLRLGQAGQGLVIREKEPENLEFPFENLRGFITNNDQFYVRSHFKVPTVDVKTWRLKVEGAVSTPIDLSYDDIVKMESRTIPVTLECAGNGRVFLSRTARGAQWELGAVSNATWTGVPLAAVLKRAGLANDAVDIVLEGADSGTIKDEPKPPDAIHFARSLPLAKAMDPDVLLAYRMNGEELPLSHGFPLRVVVPGWYGVASVKWLSRIVAMSQPFGGHFQTVDYAYWERRNGLPSRRMISEMLVKSQIARPSIHEVVAAGSTYRMSGAAWTSSGQVSRVQVTADGGANWADAKLVGQPVPHAWRLWEFEWRAPAKPGKIALMSRATDSEGRIQPLTRDLDRANYMISHTLPIDVIVR